MQKIKDYIYYNRKELIISFIFIVILLTYIIINNITHNEEVEYEKNIFKIEEVETEKEDAKEVDEKIVVDIKGEVNNPGTYEMSQDKRVSDVINDAGGLTDKASTDNINLSKKVEDEMVIVVSDKEEANIEKETLLTDNIENNSTGKISINNADEKELTNIKGIGPSKAKSIIEYRNKNGQFNSIEEITNVKGIGKATFEKIKDYIKL